MQQLKANRHFWFQVQRNNTHSELPPFHIESLNLHTMPGIESALEKDQGNIPQRTVSISRHINVVEANKPITVLVP